MSAFHPTDLQFIVSLGYEERNVRQALQLCNGDRKAALSLLKKGVSGTKLGREDVAWREEKPGDWRDGVSQCLPQYAENRGLWKSPIYARVSSVSQFSEEPKFVVNVILRSGKKWKVDRTYGEFSKFKSLLPLGTCVGFKNMFPLPSLFKLNSVALEARRSSLEEWLRELLMTESAMNNKTILQLTYQFFGSIDSTPGRQNPAPNRSNSIMSLPSVPTKVENLPTSIDVTGFPLHMNDFVRRLPFSFKLGDYVALAQSIDARKTAKDGSKKQLAKDIGRDRIVVQGRRVDGSTVEFDELMEFCNSKVSELLSSRSHLALKDEIESFCLAALREVSRTESAYVSFLALSATIRSSPDVLIIPEGSLAAAMTLQFHLLDKEDWVPPAPPIEVPHAEPAAPGTVLRLPRATASPPVSPCCSPPLPSAPELPIVQPSAPPLSECFGPREDDSMLMASSIVDSDVAPQAIAVQDASNPAPFLSPPLPWCVLAEACADTVYRITSSSDLQTVLQIRVSFRKKLFAMLHVDPAAPSGLFPVPVRIQLKEGQAKLAFYKETQTSIRDWEG